MGAETFRLCRGLLDGVMLVDNSAISAAIKDVFNETRSILEPAGAVAVAGAKAYLAREGLQARSLCSLLRKGCRLEVSNLTELPKLLEQYLQKGQSKRCSTRRNLSWSLPARLQSPAPKAYLSREGLQARSLLRVRAAKRLLWPSLRAQLL